MSGMLPWTMMTKTQINDESAKKILLYTVLQIVNLLADLIHIGQSGFNARNQTHTHNTFVVIVIFLYATKRDNWHNKRLSEIMEIKLCNASII